MNLEQGDAMTIAEYVKKFHEVISLCTSFSGHLSWDESKVY